MSKIIKKIVLPYNGEVFVKEGEKVLPGTLIVKSEYYRERPFIIEIANSLKVPLNEISDYLLKRQGDFIESGEEIARRKTITITRRKTITTNYTVESPVSGTLEYISPFSGTIVIREKVSPEDLGPVTVDCPKLLNVSPKQFKNYIKKKIGSRVEKGGILAEDYPWKAFTKKVCKSPIYGEISDIDFNTGVFTVRRPIDIEELKSYVSGVVKEVIPERGVIIEFEGYIINGKFGIGGERYGKLGKDIVILKEPLSREYYDKNKDLQGIITPSIDVEEFIDIFGDDIKKGISRDKPGLPTVILMEGFGNKSMKEGIFDEFIGRDVVIDGRTQIRAGAKRPEIVILNP